MTLTFLAQGKGYSQTYVCVSINIHHFSEPTWLDAVVFSHLHCILSMPQIVDGQFTDEERRQASTLHKLARKHENLVRYSKSIYENWLK
jgi:metaxin